MRKQLSLTISRLVWFIVLAICIYLFTYISRNTALGLKAYRWPVEKGEIIESKGNKHRFHRDEEYSYSVFVKYRYHVNGETYTNNVIQFTQTQGPLEPAKQLLQKLPVGRIVSVRYKPDQPHVSTLLPGVDKHTKIVLSVLLIAGLISACGMVFGWRWQRSTR